MPQLIRTLIVDDEPLARKKIVQSLSSDPAFSIVGECKNGHEALASIAAEKPNVIFLDVQMPELDGFDVLKSLDAKTLPLVVFVTAYDKYAIAAFEAHALDYLLKPFSKNRFQKTLTRIKAEFEHPASPATHERLLGLLNHLNTPYTERLVVKHAGRVVFVNVAEIDWLEADGNYVQLHANKDTHLIRQTLSHLETTLDPKRFARIHRSVMVQLDRIKELQPTFNGDYAVILKDGSQLTLSRTYRDTLASALGISF
jgi:two-component system LytT family response regulator